MRRLAALSLLLLLPVLAACGSSQPEQPPSPSRTPGSPLAADPDSRHCRELLPQTVVQALAKGQPQLPVATRIGDLNACRWDVVPGSEWVQVVDVPAAEWAAQLPALLDQAVTAGALDKAARLWAQQSRHLLATHRHLSGREACHLFTTMAVAIQHQRRGADHAVNFVPSQADPQAVNAQRCQGGRYTSVQLVAPELQGTAAELRRALAALDAVTS